jgi:hypothetical protein
MGVFFAFFFLATLTVWVGSVVFFSFFATRHLFEAAPPAVALRAAAPMTESYLRLGWICGLLAMISVLFLPPIEGAYSTTRIALVAVMFLVSLYLAFGLGGRVRDLLRVVEGVEGEALPKEAMTEFESVRETAGQLNGSLLLLGAVVVFITAFYG